MIPFAKKFSNVYLRSAFMGFIFSLISIPFSFFNIFPFINYGVLAGISFLIVPLLLGLILGLEVRRRHSNSARQLIFSPIVAFFTYYLVLSFFEVIWYQAWKQFPYPDGQGTYNLYRHEAVFGTGLSLFTFLFGIIMYQMPLLPKYIATKIQRRIAK